MLNKQKLVVFLLKLCRWVKLLSVRGDADMPGYKQKVTTGQSSLCLGLEMNLPQTGSDR